MEMPVSVHTVTHIDQSKNGKDRVYFDGKNNWQDAYYVKQGLRMPALGLTIEAETSSQVFGNSRNPTWFLNEWRPADFKPAQAVGAAQRAASPNSPQDRGNGQSWPKSPAERPQSQGWDIPTGDLSRYVSNIVGSAIAAGLIKKPVDIFAWTAVGYRSAEQLRTGTALAVDIREPDPNEGQEQDGEGEADPDDIPF
jgi:hypothetical protein